MYKIHKYNIVIVWVWVWCYLCATPQFSLVLVAEEITANLRKLFLNRTMLSVVSIICVLTVFASGHNIVNRIEELYRWKQLGYDQLSSGIFTKISFKTFFKVKDFCLLDHILSKRYCDIKQCCCFPNIIIFTT